MIFPDVPFNEEERLKVLEKYKILDTLHESQFNDIAKAASIICETPISLISLVDRHRQWFKATVGVDVPELPRKISFCGHAILQNDLFMIKDAQSDERFKNNPLVLDDPHIRFYAGFPLVAPTGHHLGTLCVIDTKPKDLSEEQIYLLKTLSTQVIKNIELNQSIYNLNKRMNEIHFMRIEIEDQHAKIEEKNRKISESLNYAKRLQSSMLPSEKDLAASFKEHFVFYKAKDIVGGDFYYHKVLNNRTYIALGDCTGHGAPGAMLSILAKTLLDNAIISRGLENPNEILADLHFNVVKVMNQQESEIRDGLDIILCVIDNDNKTFHYSSAKGAMLLAEKNTVSEAEIDRNCIGGVNKNGDITRTYTLYSLPYNPECTYYLYSDGFVDQFGETNQKFMKKRLKSLILDIMHLPLINQKERIVTCFDDWKGYTSQIDDVSVIGFRI